MFIAESDSEKPIETDESNNKDWDVLLLSSIHNWDETAKVTINDKMAIRLLRSSNQKLIEALTNKKE